MGIKTLQDLVSQTFPGLHFPASLEAGTLSFGTPYASQLIKVDAESGKVTYRSSVAEGERWSAVHHYLTTVLGPEGVVAALAADDKHGLLTPVYIVDSMVVREEQCEKFGWPEVTITGERMYENTAFRTREAAEAALVQNLKSLLRMNVEYRLADATTQVQKAQDRLQRYLDEDTAARQLLQDLTGKPFTPEESVE